jgi:branched-chain amino acid transport system ATP-binding protein
VNAVVTSEPVASDSNVAAALTVDGICSRYGKSQVLSDLSLEVKPGQVAVLLGRNGAGKTTTLRTISGVHAPFAGTVRLGGKNVTGIQPFLRVREGLAMVPPGARAFGPLSVEDNLRLVRGRDVTGPDRWTIERVYDFFPKLRVLRASASGSLSGGERQMLAVGRALMANPTVIMLDEPSEGLAPVIVQSIAALLGQLRDNGIAVLLAEQNHHMAMRVADHCYFIEKGRVVYSGSVDEARDGNLVGRYLGV